MPERVSRDASLGLEGTPRYRGPQDHLTKERSDDITGPVKRAPGGASVPEVPPVESAKESANTRATAKES